METNATAIEQKGSLIFITDSELELIIENTDLLAKFIYYTTKRGTNTLKSTKFSVVGIGRIRTKIQLAEAMTLKLDIVKECKITGRIEKPDYENFKWVEQKKIYKASEFWPLDPE